MKKKEEFQPVVDDGGFVLVSSVCVNVYGVGYPSVIHIPRAV